MEIKVLIIEEDEATLKLMAELLTRNGLLVSTVQQKTEALTKIAFLNQNEETKLDLIILDSTPFNFASGEELISIVEKTYPKIKIMVISTEAKIERYYNMKNIIFFRKPLTEINLLVQRIRSLFHE